MAGREIIRSEIFGLPQQFLELDAAIALDTGIGRASPAVFVYELVNHLVREVVAGSSAHNGECRFWPRRAAILDRAERTAPAVFALLRVFLPNLQRDADNVVSFLLQQRRRYRAIYAAAHRGDDYSLAHRLTPLLYIITFPSFIMPYRGTGCKAERYAERKKRADSLIARQRFSRVV